MAHVLLCFSVLRQSFSKWLGWRGEDYHQERQRRLEDQLLRREATDTIVGHSQPPNSHEESLHTGFKTRHHLLRPKGHATTYFLQFCFLWVLLGCLWKALHVFFRISSNLQQSWGQILYTVFQTLVGILAQAWEWWSYQWLCTMFSTPLKTKLYGMLVIR